MATLCAKGLRKPRGSWDISRTQLIPGKRLLMNADKNLSSGFRWPWMTYLDSHLASSKFSWIQYRGNVASCAMTILSAIIGFHFSYRYRNKNKWLSNVTNSHVRYRSANISEAIQHRYIVRKDNGKSYVDCRVTSLPMTLKDFVIVWPQTDCISRRMIRLR